MRTIHYALGAILGVSLLAGCGGGGGGGGGSGGGGSPTAVVITEASAKPVAAHAVENTQSTSATEGGGGLLTGVQVQAGGSTPTYAASVRALTKLVQPQPSTATGVAFTETVPCDVSGTVTYSGNVSGGDALIAGDSLTMSASSCVMNIEGTQATMNGSFSMTVISGSLGDAYPFHIVLATSATNFSVSADGETVVSNGDMQLDWTATSSTSETLAATGASFTNRLTSAGGSFSSTWKNYTQTLAYDGTTITGSLSATVETNSTKLGASGGSYVISTPTPLVWDSVTGNVTAGQIRVVGASNSSLLMTVTATNTFSLQVDADGNGTYEVTLTATVAELEAAL